MNISSRLTKNDYVNILDYYKLDVPKYIKDIKKKAEHTLAGKLCRCIKKLGLDNEPRSIGICTKSIFNRKGLKRGIFTCKKKRTVVFSKKNNEKTPSRKGKTKSARKRNSIKQTRHKSDFIS